MKEWWCLLCAKHCTKNERDQAWKSNHQGSQTYSFHSMTEIQPLTNWDSFQDRSVVEKQGQHLWVEWSKGLMDCIRILHWKWMIGRSLIFSVRSIGGNLIWFWSCVRSGSHGWAIEALMPCYERALESIGRNQFYWIESENENLIILHCASALYTRNRENKILTN